MAIPRSPVPYWFWNLLLRIVFAFSCRIHILHRERSARKGAWILACNHISHFDPPMLSNICRRRIDWMAMEELFRGRVFPFLLRLVGAFPVYRGKPDRAALKEAGSRLEAKRVVGIFPEGGIRDGEQSILAGKSPRPGLSLLAAKYQAPVLPCVILGTDRLYNKKQWRPFRRTPIWIAFGEPFSLPEGEIGHEARKDLESRLVSELSALKTELSETFQLTSDDFPKPPLERMKAS